MRTIMNKILLVGGLFAAVPATAQTYDPRYPVCIEVYTIDGSTIDCSFTSIAQCAATASGQAAQCYANPMWCRATNRAWAHRRRDGTDSACDPLSGRG